MLLRGCSCACIHAWWLHDLCHDCRHTQTSSSPLLLLVISPSLCFSRVAPTMPTKTCKTAWHQTTSTLTMSSSNCTVASTSLQDWQQQQTHWLRHETVSLCRPLFSMGNLTKLSLSTKSLHEQAECTLVSFSTLTLLFVTSPINSILRHES